ncbi:putative DNA binding domain-containing protein [Streptomyces sp. NBC_00727]|uniref:ATP-binding protein n=1 Tax=Streptomyces sp. NBC_00727 TaxID=2903675 RepID=UPI003866CB8C
MAAVNANDVDLAEVLGTRETPSLEFKSTAKRQGKRGDAIGNAVCAMANDLCGAGGGDILVGVDDEGRALDGVDVSDTALLALTDLRDDGRILDRPSFVVHPAVYQGKPIVRIHVNASDTTPVRFEGVDLDAPIADDQELRQNLVDVSERLEPLLRSNLRTRLVEDGFRESRQPDYPLEALREICMNALMHRNYETSYAPTRIVWFDDRIEVTNPGGPFGQVREDNFDRVTDYRNPSLAAALKGLGYVNRFGRGIGRVHRSLESNGNPPAEFQIDDVSWAVIIRRAAA